MTTETEACPICYEDLNGPIALPCTHTLCRDCYKKILVEEKFVKCPVCRGFFCLDETLGPMSRLGDLADTPAMVYAKNGAIGQCPEKFYYDFAYNRNMSTVPIYCALTQTLEDMPLCFKNAPKGWEEGDWQTVSGNTILMIMLKNHGNQDYYMKWVDKYRETKEHRDNAGFSTDDLLGSFL